MSYADFETSVELAQPIRLYAFTIGTRTWRYNSTDAQVLTSDGKVWLPASIEDDGVKQSGESTTDALTIRAQSNIAPAQLFKLATPSAAMAVVISEKHVDDSEVYVQYVGEVSQFSEDTPGTATFTCETISASFEREGLRIGWQRACPYALYDQATCKVQKESYRITSTVVAINGMDITINGMPAGSTNFSGGFIEWEHPVKGHERIGIEAQSENAVVLFGFPTELYVGMTILVYRGCNQTPDSCKSFGNYANYGGFPSLPGKSPFDGLNSPFF